MIERVWVTDALEAPYEPHRVVEAAWGLTLVFEEADGRATRVRIPWHRVSAWTTLPPPSKDPS